VPREPLQQPLVPCTLPLCYEHWSLKVCALSRRPVGQCRRRLSAVELHGSHSATVGCTPLRARWAESPAANVPGRSGTVCMTLHILNCSLSQFSARCVMYGAQNDAQSNLLRCAWSPDGSKVSCGSADKMVNVWEVFSGRYVSIERATISADCFGRF